MSEIMWIFSRRRHSKEMIDPNDPAWMDHSIHAGERGRLFAQHEAVR
jgi:hypothetical protein